MARRDQNSKVMISEVAKTLKLTTYLSSRKYLVALYTAMKEQAIKYSYRKFSEDLGFGATNYLHLICQQKRKLSKKAAAQIGEALELKAKEKRYLNCLAAYESAKKVSDKEKIFEELMQITRSSLPTNMSKDQLEYFAEWYHPVVRELVCEVDGVGDVDSIVEKIFPKITPDKVKKSLELLQRIGYIDVDPQTNSFVAKAKHIRTPKEARGMALSRYHHKILDLAKDSITSVSAKRRDISCITIAVDEDFADEIKDEIQQFRAKILEKASGRKKNKQIYQMSIQLFPCTSEEK